MSTSSKNENARKFALEVKKLATKYDLNCFLITDGFSVYLNKGNNPVVRYTRNACTDHEVIGPYSTSIKF